MKKFFSGVLASAMLLTLVGCGGNTASSPASGSGETKPLVIQIGYEMNPGEPMDIACKEWKRLVEEKSNGSMVIELFPSSQLGNKDDLMDQMIAGEAVITTGSAGYFADRGVPDMGITFGPYMFENWEQLDKVLASEWWAGQCGLLEDQGLKILSSWHFGERHTMTVKPVNSVKDFKGMKIRVPSNKIQVEGFKVLGAAPIPMALGEVYTSLQQGTIDGLENPLATLEAGKFQEVAKYLVLDGHIKDFTSWVCGTTFFESLTDEQKEILSSCAKEAGIMNNEIAEETHAKALEKMKEEGVTVIELDHNELKEATKGFYEMEEFTSVWSEGLYDTVQGIING